MPDIATAPTATNAQARAAGTKLLGYYVGAGPVNVDCLIDMAMLPVFDASGNLGIGTPSPTSKVDILSSTAGVLHTLTGAGVANRTVIEAPAGKNVEFHQLVTGNQDWCFGVDAADSYKWKLASADDAFASAKLTVSTSGNVGIGTTSPGAKLHINDPGTGQTFSNAAGGDFNIGLLAGTGSKNAYLFNRAASDLIIGTNNVSCVIIDTSGHVIPAADNTRNLGSGSLRWGTVYAATGTINTSDQRHKVWQEPTEDRTAKDRRIARRILDELGWYQFTDAVQAKGPDGARWHFGARAQRVWQIVADEGLAPPLIDLDGELLPDLSWQGPVAPAWLCFDTWNETFVPEMADVTMIDEVARRVPTEELGDDGEPITKAIIGQVERTESQPTGNQIKTRDAGYLFGFRTDQINMLLNWSLHERLAALETGQ